MPADHADWAHSWLGAEAIRAATIAAETMTGTRVDPRPLRLQLLPKSKDVRKVRTCSSIKV
jgi:hypothetical protein